MAKRIVTKIGDVFCVDLKDGTKGYVQYIANDLTQLNSSVIRVFRTHYKNDENPTIDEIVSDEVDFYAHTVLRVGIDYDVWHKIGKSKNLGEEKLDNVVFCQAAPPPPIGIPKPTGPLDSWSIWRINYEMMFIGRMPKSLHNILEEGGVEPAHWIRDRMYYGYYPQTMDVYNEIKRIPRPDAYSYVRYEVDGTMVYLCYYGDDWIKGVIVKDGEFAHVEKSVRASILILIREKLSDHYWIFVNFISEEEFDKVWSQAIKTNL